MRAVLTAALFLALASPAFAGSQVLLRQTLSSHGAEVTLADLFDGVPPAARRIVVAPAAQTGFNAVIEASKAQLAAQAAGLVWDNPTGLRRLLVSAVDNGPGAPKPAARPQVLTWAHNLNAGDIVQASDLVWSDAVVAGPGAPDDPARLIGQAARRPLRAGAAAQRSDLAAPAMVHRDEMVAVAFQAAGVSLVLQGRAMKDAALGEVVQVMNLQSKKIIEAVASGPGEAVVGPRAEALKAAPFTTASLR